VVQHRGVVPAPAEEQRVGVVGETRGRLGLAERDRGRVGPGRVVGHDATVGRRRRAGPVGPVGHRDAVGGQVLPRRRQSLGLPFECSHPAGPAREADRHGPGTGADLDGVVAGAGVEFGERHGPDLRFRRAGLRVVGESYPCHA
jgi:hypothetical protein